MVSLWERLDGEGQERNTWILINYPQEIYLSVSDLSKCCSALTLLPLLLVFLTTQPPASQSRWMTCSLAKSKSRENKTECEKTFPLLLITCVSSVGFVSVRNEQTLDTALPVEVLVSHLPIMTVLIFYDCASFFIGWHFRFSFSLTCSTKRICLFLSIATILLF